MLLYLFLKLELKAAECDEGGAGAVRLYQAGAAEYAEVQASRLCQLHDGLETKNKSRI